MSGIALYVLWVERVIRFSLGPLDPFLLLLIAWVISLIGIVVLQAYLELKVRYRGTRPQRTFLRSCLFFLVLQGALIPGTVLVLSFFAVVVLSIVRLI